MTRVNQTPRTRESAPTDGGYSTVEFVIIVPLIAAATLLVVQIALIWHAHTVAEGAARQGVQAARAYTATNEDGRRQARAYLTAVDPELLPHAQIDVSRTGTTVTVHIHAHILTAGIPLTFSIDTRSSGPIERFVPPPAPQ